MTDSFPQLLAEIRHIYLEIDQQIATFQKATDLHCPEGCGSCCDSQEVEATVTELLPLADAIFQSGRPDALAELIEQSEKKNTKACVLYQPDPLLPGNGRCGQYPHRPLVCRLFGFAARYDRSKDLEFSTCKKIKIQDPQKVWTAQELIRAGLSVPVFQACFMRLASLHPGPGFQRYAINQALKKALEFCYWKKLL
ncbi:MAG: YkgJ family cysteine cluster protein [Desulfobacteraceae bacterium]|nr:MAG: YkgJ family cysteine cluster protein [Desulfobacteraceae bacterium]